ncbi:MAG: hypothetical protein MUF54_15170 [Polyangiaceae bacterium]|nr:hypothetical protein [Polyangiaceae bacterium]
MGDHKSWLRSFGARREPPECSQYMLVATYPKGPVIPNERAEQAAAASLAELTDDQFARVVKAEADRRRWRPEAN